MLDLSALLIDAATKGQRARDEALVALASPPHAPSQAEVDAVLATLPAKLAAALTQDPSASYVDLLVAHSRGEKALAQAVSDCLGQRGVATLLQGFGHAEPLTVRVNVVTIFQAGASLTEERALLAFAEAWGALTGGTAITHTAAGTLLATAPDVGTYALSPGWQTRPTADLVEEARTSLRLPCWTLAALGDAWRSIVGDPLATVEQVLGFWRDGIHRPVPALAFVTSVVGRYTHLDIADTLDMTTAEVVSLAASTLGLTVTDDDAPDSAPAAQQSATPTADGQATRHLTRSERRALRRQAHA